MSAVKDMIRLSLGLVQEETGNNAVLRCMTEGLLKTFIVTSNADIWTRNSYNFEAHIPLLSDLDLTLLADSTEAARKLLEKKKMYLLVGEINFYHSAIREHVIKLGNSFEIARDPILVSKLNLSLRKTEAERIAFIMRQVYSDQKWLQTFPKVRTKKWAYLFLILGEKPLSIPSNEKILSIVPQAEVRKDAMKMLSLGVIGNDIYDHSENASWKYLFPQCHLWYLKPEKDLAYLATLNTFQKEILKEQVKWEFWGIGCHYYWLPKEVALKHLRNMMRLITDIGVSDDELYSMQMIVKFIEDQT